MTDELKRCPFCGGEAEMREGSSTRPYVRCKVCGCRTGSSKYRSAVKSAWNVRAERTCRVEYPDDARMCSECHYYVGPHHLYCPHCGARVVS